MNDYFCDLVRREFREVAPGVRIRTFWQSEMLLSYVDLDAHAVVPSHSHPHEQCGTVISGEATFIIGGEERTLRAGDCYMIPGGIEHEVRVHDAPAVVLDVFAPVREAYQY